MIWDFLMEKVFTVTNLTADLMQEEFGVVAVKAVMIIWGFIVHQVMADTTQEVSFVHRVKADTTQKVITEMALRDGL